MSKSISYPPPTTFNIARPSWRPQQYETVLWAKDTHYDADSRPVVKIAEQCTGSGKSQVAMALNDGTDVADQIIVLTHTRSLQRQYEQEFPDCHVQFGRANYPCPHHAQPLHGATAEDCLFRRQLNACYAYRDDQCPYYVARRLSKNSPRVAFNYAYWLSAGIGYDPTWLVMDEAHSLSDITLDHIGISISQAEVEKRGLPALPTIESPELAIYSANSDVHGTALTWLERALHILDARIANYEHIVDERKHPRAVVDAMLQLRSYNNFRGRLENISVALQNHPGQHWFIRSGPQEIYSTRGMQPGMIIKPLTARYDFSRLFLNNAAKPMLMSATIGKMSIFANELGIKHWEGRTVPSQWPASSRPVYILDAPSMGRRNTTNDTLAFDKQADVIAKAILAQPEDWCGFILVTRKAETLALAKRLSERGLIDRIFPIVGDNLTYIPTDQQLQMWEARKQKVPNSIGISHSFWQGINGKMERILIVAKTPFASLAENYERARMQYDLQTFYWRAACTLEQGLGRTRRGNPEDYDINGQVNGFVGIADADWVKLKPYLSSNIKEALVGA